MADPSSPSPFQGFDTPRQNWFRMPNEWVDLCAEISSLAELKVVQYVMRHTWGHQEYGIKKRISLDEFMYGRRRKDGSRIDKGTGLTKKSVIAGIKSAVERGFLIEDVDDSDKARVKKYFLLRMAVDSEDDGFPSESSDLADASSQDRGEKVNADVYFLHPGVEKVYIGGKESIHRSEKDTLERHLQKDNNTHGDTPHAAHAVVVALSSRGISPLVAEQLSRKHNQAFVEEKIEFHDFLLANRPSDIKKPAAWLRRAIEDDYKAPDGFVSRSERQRQADEAKRRKQAVLAAQEERERESEQSRQSEQKQVEARLALLREQYGTTLEALDLWAAVKDQLEYTLSAPMFALVADSHIVQMDRESATVAVTAAFKLNQLEQKRIRLQIEQAAQDVAGRPIALTFTLLT